jgi:hypothetical protein
LQSLQVRLADLPDPLAILSGLRDQRFMAGEARFAVEARRLERFVLLAFLDGLRVYTAVA